MLKAIMEIIWFLSVLELIAFLNSWTPMFHVLQDSSVEGQCPEPSASDESDASSESSEEEDDSEGPAFEGMLFNASPVSSEDEQPTPAYDSQLPLEPAVSITVLSQYSPPHSQK